MIVAKQKKLSIRRQCVLLNIQRSLHYYQAIPASKENVSLMNEIREVWLRYPFYGYRRITKALQATGYKVNKKRIQCLMQQMDIRAICPKTNSTNQGKNHLVYPYLLEDVTIDRINQVWQVDITYLRHKSSFMYLVALIDLCSRYIVGWSLSNTLHADFCIEALEQGLKKYNLPEIINSDQGSQFTSEEWTSSVIEAGVKISMTGKGRCHDNIFIERFWRSVKYEEIYLNEYDCVKELRKAIDDYIQFYNYKRFHQALNYKTPAEVYFSSNKEHEVEMSLN